VLEALAAGPGPVTVAHLADALGGHPNSARGHLATLVAGGLATAAPLPAAGRGRPAVGYALTDSGRGLLGSADAPAADLLGQEYAGLTSALATHLRRRSTKPRREARAVGRIWGESLAARATEPATELATGEGTDRGTDAGTDGGTGERHEHAGNEHAGNENVGSEGDASPRRRTVHLLDRLGFSPVTEPGSVALHTCPLLEAARADPGVVCEIHLGLITGALEAFGGHGPGADLVPFAEPGACRLIWRT
jgi:predicted ArsR family transcriptional regulator